MDKVAILAIHKRLERFDPAIYPVSFLTVHSKLDCKYFQLNFSQRESLLIFIKGRGDSFDKMLLNN